MFYLLTTVSRTNLVAVTNFLVYLFLNAPSKEVATNTYEYLQRYRATLHEWSVSLDQRSSNLVRQALLRVESFFSQGVETLREAYKYDASNIRHKIEVTANAQAEFPTRLRTIAPSLPLQISDLMH